MSRLRPKIGTAKLTDKEKEKYFIGLYVKEGAIDEKIPYAEQRASLEPGAGHRILRRKRVQEEIKARTEPVRFEQRCASASSAKRLCTRRPPYKKS
jgi:hypothetical protein